MGRTVETLNETVDAGVEALPADMRARLARIAKLIEENGLERIGEPQVIHEDDYHSPAKGRHVRGPRNPAPAPQPHLP
jgi:hypothetical protein